MAIQVLAVLLPAALPASAILPIPLPSVAAASTCLPVRPSAAAAGIRTPNVGVPGVGAFPRDPRPRLAHLPVHLELTFLELPVLEVCCRLRHAHDDAPHGAAPQLDASTVRVTPASTKTWTQLYPRRCVWRVGKVSRERFRVFKSSRLEGLT
jgi:hypothetical protein